MEIIKAKDMQLADVVRLRDNTSNFGTETVKQIKNEVVTLFRPYVHTADFSCTAGVICYVGIEEHIIYIDSDTEYVLLERQNLK